MPRNDEDGASPTRLLNAAELAKELKISPWLLGELRRRGGVIPKPIRLGSLVRWRQIDIVRMLEKLARQPFVPRRMRGAVRRQAERKAGKILHRERL